MTDFPDSGFFAGCFAAVFVILWFIFGRLKRIEEKLDKMIGK